MEIVTKQELQPLYNEISKLTIALYDLRKQQADTIYEIKTSVIMPLSMPIAEAARYRGCSVSHLRDLIKAGYIKPIYLGHSGINISTKDLENLPAILTHFKN